MDEQRLLKVHRAGKSKVDTDDEQAAESPRALLISGSPFQHLPVRLGVKLAFGGVLLHILLRSKRTKRCARSTDNSRAAPRDGKVELLRQMLLDVKYVCLVFEASTVEHLNDRLLLRWLRARKGDVQAAFAALCVHARWRTAEMPNGRVLEVRKLASRVYPWLD